MKKIAIALVVCLLLSGCAVGGGAGENGVVVTDSLAGKPVLVGDIPCEFPLAGAGAALKIMATGHGDTDQADVYVWQKYEQMTGVSVDWITVTKA